MSYYRTKQGGRKVNVSWEIILAFFLGGATSSLAQDPSDTIYFWAQSTGQLNNPGAQAIYWYWVPFALYIGLFALGYLLAKFTPIRPKFLLYFFLSLVVISTFVSLSIPSDRTNPIYAGSVLLGTIVSFGIILGLKKQARAR